VATALARGRPGLSAFEAEALSDGSVRDLLQRTTVAADPELGAAYPLRWGAGVEVDADGVGQWSARRGFATGDPEAPLSDAELDAKVLGLFAWAGVESRRGRSLLRRSRRLAEDGPLFSVR
jgi:2-methylcitrate dehydratase PrpD